MQLTLHTDRESYRPGEPVQLRVEVFNDAAEPVTLFFSSSQKCDFEVLWEDQLLWRWSADRVFAQMLTEETLAPGERRRYEATWAGRRSDGALARPGEYNARGVLTTSSRADRVPALRGWAEQTFTIID
jgi:hypothetical protein